VNLILQLVQTTWWAVQSYFCLEYFCRTQIDTWWWLFKVVDEYTICVTTSEVKWSRVPGYRSRGRVRFPALPDFLRNRGSRTGSTASWVQLRSYLEEIAAPVYQLRIWPWGSFALTTRCWHELRWQAVVARSV
jgi:hypothetical protein